MNLNILFTNNVEIFFTELYLISCILVLLIYGVCYTTSNQYNYPILIKNISWLSIQVLFISTLLIYNNPIPILTIFNHVLIHDNFTSFIKIIILISTLICILMSFNYINTEKLNSYEYIILILLATLGMLLLVSSYDLISMYLAIEMQSLSLYVLATFKKNSSFSTEAGLKYFILGAFASGLLLFGSSMIYGFTGTTNFEELAKIFTGVHTTLNLVSSGILVGIVFIASGLLFKLTAVPFHMWAPDVYEGSPTSVTAFFAIVPKISLLALFLRLYLYSFYDLIEHWQQIIIFCAIGSMIIGSFVAIQQQKIKRLLAYSSIGHIGYMLVGLATGTIEGIQGLLIYIIIYMIMSINIWSVVLITEKYNNGSRAKYLTDLRSLSIINPLLAFTIVATMFSMAGIPPLAGFCAKLYVFFAAMESSMYLVAIVGVLTSVISSFYYIRLIKIMYFEKKLKWNFYKPIDREKSLLLGSTFLFLIFFFISPNSLLLITHKMALFLCL
jgi:proton-translocating NADH-quinone oxidoreductase chain N